MPKLTVEEMKERFLQDTPNHSMEVLRDDGIYRHLKFSNNGSQVYRFDLLTWPGHLCVCGDMGTYVFTRLPDMFEFFGDDFDGKYPINQGYWGEKLDAMDGHHDNSFMKFDEELFAENVWNDYNQFAEDYAEEDDVAVTEAYPEDTQTYAQMLEELKEAIQEEVIDCSYDGEVRAYDAAMNFRWESSNGELKFDMQDFWDYNCRDYTFHYTWILFAIVWGIREYNRYKEKQAA